MTSAIGTYFQRPAGAIGGAATNPVANYTTPSLAPPSQQWQTSRGLCTLNAPGVGTLQFRTNPNEITWDYQLKTHVEQTYGGRIIQILGARLDNLVVKVDCGQGGWPYANYVQQFLRNMMVTQRNGMPGTFTYTTRNWVLKVFSLNVPFEDQVTATVRELTLNFKVQQDVSGVQTASSIANALNALRVGIGFLGTELYGSGVGTAPNNAYGGGPATILQNTPMANQATALTGPLSSGLPGVENIVAGSGLGGLFGF